MSNNMKYKTLSVADTGGATSYPGWKEPGYEVGGGGLRSGNILAFKLRVSTMFFTQRSTQRREYFEN